MSEQSIGTDAGMGGVGGNFSLDAQSAPPQTVNTPFLNDSMSVSELATFESNNMADPGNPRLQKPTYADLVMQFQLGMAEIVTTMLTNWNKSLQEEAERVKVELSSPSYQSWMEQHSAKYLAEQDIKAGVDLVIPTKNASDQQSAITTGALDEKDRYAGLMDRYTQLAGMSSLITSAMQSIESTRSSVSDPENSSISLTKNAGGDLAGYTPPMSTAASLAIGAGFVAAFSQIPDVVSTSQIEVKPIQDAWNSINPAANDQITQIGGWFSAMWGIGLVYQLSAQNIAELGAGFQRGPHKDLEFAKGYAQTLINSLEGNAFNIQLLALLTPMIEQSQETKARQNPELLATKGKLILLALALALVYKLELKSKDPNAVIDEKTFAAMLAGKIDFNRNDEFETAELKRQLVFHFQYHLQALPTSERVKLVEGILAYMAREAEGEGSGVEKMIDQQTIFSTIFEEGSTDQAMREQNPV